MIQFCSRRPGERNRRSRCSSRVPGPPAHPPRRGHFQRLSAERVRRAEPGEHHTVARLAMDSTAMSAAWSSARTSLPPNPRVLRSFSSSVIASPAVEEAFRLAAVLRVPAARTSPPCRVSRSRTAVTWSGDVPSARRTARLVEHARPGRSSRIGRPAYCAAGRCRPPSGRCRRPCTRVPSAGRCPAGRAERRSSREMALLLVGVQGVRGQFADHRHPVTGLSQAKARLPPGETGGGRCTQWGPRTHARSCPHHPQPSSIVAPTKAAV